MKNKIYALALLFVVASSSAMAQGEPPRGDRNQQFDPKEMIEKRTEHMAEQYGLNKKQTKKLKKLNEKYKDMLRPMGGQPPMAPPSGDDKAPKAQPQQQNRPPREQMDQMRKRMDEDRNAYNSELQKIMTADQFAKYMSDEKSRERQRPSHPDDKK